MLELYLIQNLQYENHRAIKLSPQKRKKKGEGGYFYPNWSPKSAGIMVLKVVGETSTFFGKPRAKEQCALVQLFYLIQKKVIYIKYFHIFLICLR